MAEFDEDWTPAPQRLGMRDEVLAELHPPSAAQCALRMPGALRGRIRMSPDFDTLPAEILAAMEGEAD